MGVCDAGVCAGRWTVIRPRLTVWHKGRTCGTKPELCGSLQVLPVSGSAASSSRKTHRCPRGSLGAMTGGSAGEAAGGEVQ